MNFELGGAIRPLPELLAELRRAAAAGSAGDHGLIYRRGARPYWNLLSLFVLSLLKIAESDLVIANGRNRS
jgi:hypothetical protein